MIDVVFVDVADDDAVVDALRALLNDEERGRADRYRFADDRRRSIVARAATRRLVSRALGTVPQELQIIEEAHGKPALADGALHFNASHSGDLVAVAIAPFEIGVDVERLRDLSPRALAERFYSPAERARVAASADPLAEFLTIWTAKEAIVKATGQGIAAADLRGFTVPHFGDWRAEPLAPPREGYFAAVAARTAEWRVHVRTIKAEALCNPVVLN